MSEPVCGAHAMTERTIFLTARDTTDPAQRETFLDDACAGNAELRQRIESLLRADAYQVAP
jgi:hypothetical protein